MRKSPLPKRYQYSDVMGGNSCVLQGPAAGQALEQAAPSVELIGKSSAFLHLLKLIEKFKDSAAPVFIGGESGTGKEVVARSLHRRGPRFRSPFVAINCAALPEQLIESELFGYVRGAFTGALRDKPGLVEEASGGTLFLDEIGDLSPHLQAKLLRLIEEREIRRVGENRPRPVDVRFISATNLDIESRVSEGAFRQDLLYRLRILPVEIEPLRRRQEDIIPLVNYFLAKFCREMKRGRVCLTPTALQLLQEYEWPGNVRELQGEIQRCLILCDESTLITERDLSPRINPYTEPESVSSYDYFRAKADFEKRFLHQALDRFNFNRARTAQEIGLSRQGLFKLIKKHSIEIPGPGKQEGLEVP
ncbi:MAG: sigma-54 dependent transcriptional regulator [Candidatus Aminicenantaceae bacterium]